MQRTALCARKIGAILRTGIGPTAFPIYRCAAADAQTVGRQPIYNPHLSFVAIPYSGIHPII
jgi:hypothetical protein